MLCKSVISICFCWIAASIISVSGEVPPGILPALRLPLDRVQDPRVISYHYSPAVALFDAWPSVECPRGIYDAHQTKSALQKVLPDTIQHKTGGIDGSEIGFGVVDELLFHKNLIVKYKKYTLKKTHYSLLDVWELVRARL